ncbi:unnamed protein product [Diatraea saccharalis]|uniref:Sodium/calcium exchanger membrane region domain-containing protein n=1 Tax=Diatraea saccharalis TaxID=40085 RepID=A0A9N9WKT5_9NEOP|nr:unnamed protein product [Diatraea saccharalis]
MRRPRRHRWITVSVFFIAYSVLQAAFTLSNASEPASDVDLPEKIEKTEKGIQSTPADPKDEIVKVTRKYESDAITTEPRLNPEVSYEKTTGIEENIDDYTMMKDDNYVEEKKELENEINYFSGMKSDYQRVGCTPPAIEQFPKPLMGESLRKQGGLIIHVLVAVFTFIGLVIVCNEYFVSSLHRICKAGATFMAAGSSAPELATVVIGIFCAKDDIACAHCAPAPCRTSTGGRCAATASSMHSPYSLCSALSPTDSSPGNLQLLYWYMAYPIRWSCRHTIPDCRGRWYPITFIVSILWISFYSYFMVWMITIIVSLISRRTRDVNHAYPRNNCNLLGDTLGIPSTAMMLSIVAVGVSVPDALSSVAVIKEGYGDMAVSNAVGSNVFDILVCLGLPWFIQTAIIYPGYHVNVISKATHANSWKLDRKFGAVLMAWYVLLITLASLYELNIFGLTNPPDCNSAY